MRVAFFGACALLCAAQSRAFTMPSARRGAAGRRSNVRMSAGMALLFDCDGTLAETERDGHRVSFNQAFKEFDLDCEWGVDLYGKLLETGGGKERMTAHWNEVGWPSGYDSEEERTALVKKLHLRKTDIFMDKLRASEIPLRPGVEGLIGEALDRGITVAVCSTSNEKAVSTLVETLMPQYADKIPIFAGDIVEKKKPAPDVYLLAAKELGLDAKKVVVFEDTEIGLKAASAAGMQTIVTMSIYSRDEDFTGAYKVLEGLEGVDVAACEAAIGEAA